MIKEALTQIDWKKHLVIVQHLDKLDRDMTIAITSKFSWPKDKKFIVLQNEKTLSHLAPFALDAEDPNFPPSYPLILHVAQRINIAKNTLEKKRINEIIDNRYDEIIKQNSTTMKFK